MPRSSDVGSCCRLKRLYGTANTRTRAVSIAITSHRAAETIRANSPSKAPSARVAVTLAVCAAPAGGTHVALHLRAEERYTPSRKRSADAQCVADPVGVLDPHHGSVTRRAPHAAFVLLAHSPEPSPAYKPWIEYEKATRRQPSIWLSANLVKNHDRCRRSGQSVSHFLKRCCNVRREEPSLGALASPINLHDNEVRATPLNEGVRSAVSP